MSLLTVRKFFPLAAGGGLPCGPVHRSHIPRRRRCGARLHVRGVATVAARGVGHGRPVPLSFLPGRCVCFRVALGIRAVRCVVGFRIHSGSEWCGVRSVRANPRALCKSGWVVMRKENTEIERADKKSLHYSSLVRPVLNKRVHDARLPLSRDSRTRFSRPLLSPPSLHQHRTTNIGS